MSMLTRSITLGVLALGVGATALAAQQKPRGYSNYRWYIGGQAREVIPGLSPNCASRCDARAMIARWLINAAFGSPVVPLVYNSSRPSSLSTSQCGSSGGIVARRDS